LREWPAEHCVKCLVFYHPDDPAELKAEQERAVLTLFEACRRTFHELLLEVIPSKSGLPLDDRTLARALGRFYEIGVFPDWWKLPSPGSESGWQAVDAVIRQNDPYCRGVLLLGLEAPEADLEKAFALAMRFPVCKGFAVGRTIFGAAAQDWLAGKIDDATAVERMAVNYGRLIAAWERLASTRSVG
jgi:5-dehydro-2-deoxygluconokinase